jgi:hypothetical protein
MNMIATSSNAMSQLISLFNGASKGIKADAIAFTQGQHSKKNARAFLGLSMNSKMPSYTLAIPARQTCPRGDKLAMVAGTVCSGCYAMKGLDAMPDSKRAKTRRLAVVNLALESGMVAGLWLDAFKVAMRGETHFRWHSAGDIFSSQYAILMQMAIAATPHVKHWIPTRESRYADAFDAYDNVAFRVSDDMVNQDRNKHNGNTSGVHTAEHGGRGVQCPAYNNDGKCGECRMCWSKEAKHISYKIH